MGSAGRAGGALSALAVVTISRINNPCWNKGTTAAALHVEHPSFISSSEERNQIVLFFFFLWLHNKKPKVNCPALVLAEI